jgi:hypothetical protein
MNRTSLRWLLGRTVSRASLPVPIDGRVRALAWISTASLTAFVGYLLLAWRLVDFSGPRPVYFLLGWGLLRETVRLHHHAETALHLALGALGTAIVVAAVTKGFRVGRGWGQLASLATGIAGLAAAVPLLVAAAIVAVNLALWSIAAIVAVLVGLALLVRLALGGRR